MRAILHFDGSSFGNPGPAGGAAILKVDGTIYEFGIPLGRGTCNEGEYGGLILGLREAQLKGVTELEIHGDSMLVVNHINGAYRVKATRLLPLYDQAMRLLKYFQSYTISWISRDLNERADRVAGWSAQNQRPWRQPE